jgi:hypothetical protein
MATDDHDGLAAALDVRCGISDQIEGTPTKTPAGMRAKAKVAIFLLDENGAVKGAHYDFAYALLVEIAWGIAA